MTIPDWLRLRTAPGGARQPTGEVFLPLTAQQALEARREALALAEDEGALALCANACLVARGVRKGRRPFPSGKAVLAAYGPEEIETLARRWAAWNQREGLGPDLAPGRLEGLKAQLADLPWQRLQWRVLRQFRAGQGHDRRGLSVVRGQPPLRRGGGPGPALPPLPAGSRGGPVPGVWPGCRPDRPRDQPRL